MIKYGIFDGVGQQSYILAAAVMSLDDYVKIYGKTVDDYLDYLLNLQDAIDSAEEPCKLVRLPFDPDDYRKWLQSVNLKDGPEARSAWALEVAQDPEKLAEIKKKRPVLPAAPEEEREVTKTLFLSVPLLCSSDEDIGRLAERLDAAKLKKLRDKLLKAAPPLPAYRKLSPMRAAGVTLLLGDRLIIPPDAEGVEDYYLNFNARLEMTEKLARVPRHFRIKKTAVSKTGKFPILLVCLLPVVVVGASEDVEFFLEWLDEFEDSREYLSYGITEILRAAGWKEDQIGTSGLLLEAWEIPEFLRSLIEDFTSEIADEDGMDEFKEEKTEGLFDYKGQHIRKLHLVKK